MGPSVRIGMGKFYLRCFGLLLLLASCGETEEAALDPGLDYQPLGIGKFWEYEVEETMYFGESDVETDTFYYKDQIASDYINAVGEQVFLFVREKSFDRQSWQPESTYTYRISEGALVKNSENQNKVALVFPPLECKEWDANIFISDQEDTYQLELLQDYKLGSLAFSPAVKVLQHAEDDLITLRDNRYEIFAKEVGLVESYYEVLTYCSRNDCLGQQIVDSGRSTHLKLIDNG